MQDQILQVDENMLETRLDRLVSEKVEQLLNAMLDAEADEITGAARYERTGDRKAYRVGHYERDLTVKAGTVTLKVPKLKGALFESAVIERYRRREQSVEEALIDMYLAGVSTRQVDDISRLLWGERMPSQTLSDKLKGVYAQIDEWRNRPLERSYPYLFVDGVWHKRTWGGSVENVSVLVAIGVDDTGHREGVGGLCSISCCGFSHDDFSGGGWCRFVGLVVDSITTNHATRPSSRRRSMMLMPNSVLILLSRYQTMYSSSMPMNSSMVTPAKLRLWKNSCLRRPKNPSAAALSGEQPFALIERVRLLSLQMRIHSGHR